MSEAWNVSYSAQMGLSAESKFVFIFYFLSLSFRFIAASFGHTQGTATKNSPLLLTRRRMT